MDSDAVLVALLAAGRATRFGGGKLDAPCAGKPVGCWVVEAVEAAGLAPGVCVTGPAAPRFLAGAVGWSRIVNRQPEEGLGGSLAVAARAAQARNSAAMLVVLADMPLVTPLLLGRLVSGGRAAATDHGGGRPGVPALIPRALFSRLAGARGDQGAAKLLAGLAGLALVAPAAQELLDIDTPADLARAEALLMRRLQG